MLLIRDFQVKTPTKTIWKVILDTVRHEFHDVLSSVQNGRAVGARLEVSLHTRAQLGVDLAIHIVGDLSPDFRAADFNHTHMTHTLAFCFTLSVTPTVTKVAPFDIRLYLYSNCHQFQGLALPASADEPARDEFLHFRLLYPARVLSLRCSDVGRLAG